ncbi:GRIP and coiled-coil domain-containing protein 1-like [Zophobas morio]|uniref:GRIP and coiled-coil domain-containing protein 1-like n=1 Tax=Zophobas morio TaxID=2755281 RepID=UPI003083C344
MNHSLSQQEIRLLNNRIKELEVKSQDVNELQTKIQKLKHLVRTTRTDLFAALEKIKEKEEIIQTSVEENKKHHELLLAELSLKEQIQEKLENERLKVSTLEHELAQSEESHRQITACLEEDLSRANAKLEALEINFTKYKTRAQFILKQKTPFPVLSNPSENLQQKQQLDAVCAELAIWKKTSEKLRQKMELLEEENSFLARSSAEKQQKLNFELQNSQQEISRFKQLHKTLQEELEALKHTSIQMASLEKSLESLKQEKKDLLKKIESMEISLENIENQKSLEESTLSLEKKTSQSFEISNSLPSDDSQQAPTNRVAQLCGTSARNTFLLEDNLADLQLKLEHVSSLLEDSNELVRKHEDQNIVLKKEIRRLEENNCRKERFNYEYLKNILYSFLDAKTPEERKPLLLVFGQMLLFSAEEMARLLERYNLFEEANKNEGNGWNFFGI